MLSSKKRLTSADVEKVLRSGFSQSKGGIRLKLLVRTTPPSTSRYAVVVSKKVTAGSAVERNRLRRQAYVVLGRLGNFNRQYDVALTITRIYKTQKEMELDIKEALTSKII